MEITTLLLNIVLPWEPPPGSPPHLCNLPLGEDHTLYPRPGVRGSRGGPSPPLPHSSAGLAPLALVTSGCWALSLCGCEHTHTHTPHTHTTHTHTHTQHVQRHTYTHNTHIHTHTQHVPHTQHAHTHIHTHTHSACTKTHTHTHL